MPSLKKLKEAVVAAKKNSPKKTGKSSMLSKEYIEETDAEDESTESDSSVETAPKSTTKKAIPLPTLPSKGLNGPVQTKPSSSAPKAASVAPSESDSESKSGSESESTASSGSEDTSDDSPTTENKEKGSDPVRINSTIVTGIKRKLSPDRQSSKSQPPYKPPMGFEAIRASSISSTVASDMFSRSSLSGKQIWHITAPSSIPVDMIKEVSLESVAKGEAALSYKGTDYGFVVNGEGSQARKKLLTAGAGSSYQVAPMEIAQTLQLQQLVNLPSLRLTQSQTSGSSQGSTTASTPAQKPIRQQPEGLRMRFGPLGDHIGNLGKIGFDSPSDESQVDEEMAEPEFRMPRGVGVPGASVKRKHSEVNRSDANGVASPQSTRDGPKAKRKKSKPDLNTHTPKQPSSQIHEASMDLDSPTDTHTAKAAGSQQQETPGKSKDQGKERKDKNAKKERRAQKAKDLGPKGSHQNHKNGGDSSDHTHSKSITT